MMARRTGPVLSWAVPPALKSGSGSHLTRVGDVADDVRTLALLRTTLAAGGRAHSVMCHAPHKHTARDEGIPCPVDQVIGGTLGRQQRRYGQGRQAS